MKALVYHGPEKRDRESKEDPGIERPTDAVVRIDTTTICGTDLHVLKGDVPAVLDGRTLGHEAVGFPATFELCTELVRPGGHVANIGVHGAPATLHLEKLWIRNVTITTGLGDTYSTPTLLRLVSGSGRYWTPTTRLRTRPTRMPSKWSCRRNGEARKKGGRRRAQRDLDVTEEQIEEVRRC